MPREGEHEQIPDKAAAERAEAEQRRASGRDPHHDLNNPAEDPRPDEWPDPFERRPDPRGPRDEEEAGLPPASGAVSTSEPHPDQDPEAIGANPPQRRKLDR